MGSNALGSFEGELEECIRQEFEAAKEKVIQRCKLELEKREPCVLEQVTRQMTEESLHNTTKENAELKAQVQRLKIQLVDERKHSEKLATLVLKTAYAMKKEGL